MVLSILGTLDVTETFKLLKSLAKDLTSVKCPVAQENLLRNLIKSFGPFQPVSYSYRSKTKGCKWIKLESDCKE